MPPPSSPVPRLSSVLSAVLTVHTIASGSPLRHHRTNNQDEGKGGHLVQFWAKPSPHLATDRPANSKQQQGSASGCRSSCPPRPRSLPLCQVVRVGQRASQGGRSPPAHPVDPLHPCRGAVRTFRTDPGRGARGQHIRAVVAAARDSKFSGKTTRLYRSKYQLFIFSVGSCRAMPVHRGNGNCT